MNQIKNFFSKSPKLLTIAAILALCLTFGGQVSARIDNPSTGTLTPGNGGTGTSTAFTAGSVIFATSTGIYSQDNANFYWSDNQDSLFIGTNAPVFSVQTGSIHMESTNPRITFGRTGSTVPWSVGQTGDSQLNLSVSSGSNRSVVINNSGGGTGNLLLEGTMRIGGISSASVSSFTIGTSTALADQLIGIYKTADETTNYVRGIMGFEGGIFKVGVQDPASGTSEPLRLLAQNNGNEARLTLDRSAAPVFGFDYTSNSTLSPVTNFSGSNNSSSGNSLFMSLTPTYAQSSTAGYTTFLVNPTESSIGSGARYLIDAQVGGLSRFAVGASGRITVGTSTMIADTSLRVTSTTTAATTTMSIGSAGQGKGSCLELYDSAGTVQYVSIKAGAFVIESTSCK